MDDKDYKRKLNYFRHNDAPRIVGLGLLLVGFILLFCSGYLDLKYVLVIFAWIAMPVGLVLFIVSASVRCDEESIDKHMADQLLDMGLSAVEEDRYRKRLLDALHPRVLEGYEYREGVMLHKDKVSTVRSSLFSRTYLYLLCDGAYLLTRTVSLVNTEQSESRAEVCLSDIKAVDIRQEEKVLTFEKRQFEVRDVRLVFYYRDGSEVSVPVHADLELEQFVEKFREWIEKGVVTP